MDEYIEALEIRRFDPPLNIVKPIPSNHLNWRIRLQSLPMLIGTLAAAIVGLGIIEALDPHRHIEPNQIKTNIR